MNPKKYLENRIRGWLPKEPSLPRNREAKVVEISEVDRQRKFFKISLVSDAIIMNIFMGTNFLIDPNHKNINLTISSWIVFVLSLISVNFLLYRHSKKQANNQREDLKL